MLPQHINDNRISRSSLNSDVGDGESMTVHEYNNNSNNTRDDDMMANDNNDNNNASITNAAQQTHQRMSTTSNNSNSNSDSVMRRSERVTTTTASDDDEEMKAACYSKSDDEKVRRRSRRSHVDGAPSDENRQRSSRSRRRRRRQRGQVTATVAVLPAVAPLAASGSNVNTQPPTPLAPSPTTGSLDTALPGGGYLKGQCHQLHVRTVAGVCHARRDRVQRQWESILTGTRSTLTMCSHLVVKEYDHVPDFVVTGHSTVKMAHQPPRLVDSEPMLLSKRTSAFVDSLPMRIVLTVLFVAALGMQTFAVGGSSMRLVGAGCAMTAFWLLVSQYSRRKLREVMWCLDFWYVTASIAVFMIGATYLEYLEDDQSSTTAAVYCTVVFIETVGGCVFAFGCDAAAYKHVTRSIFLWLLWLDSVVLFLMVEPYLINYVRDDVGHLLTVVDVIVVRGTLQSIMASAQLSALVFVSKCVYNHAIRKRECALLNHTYKDVPLQLTATATSSPVPDFSEQGVAVVAIAGTESSATVTDNNSLDEDDVRGLLAKLQVGGVRNYTTLHLTVATLNDDLVLLDRTLEAFRSHIQSVFFESVARTTTVTTEQMTKPNVSLLVPAGAPTLYDDRTIVMLASKRVERAVGFLGHSLGPLGLLMMAFMFFVPTNSVGAYTVVAALCCIAGFGCLISQFRRGRFHHVVRTVDYLYVMMRSIVLFGMYSYVANGTSAPEITVLAAIAGGCMATYVFGLDAATYPACTKLNVVVAAVTYFTFLCVVTTAEVFPRFVPHLEYVESFDVVRYFVVVETTAQTVCVGCAFALVVFSFKFLARYYFTDAVAFALHTGALHSLPVDQLMRAPIAPLQQHRLRDDHGAADHQMDAWEVMMNMSTDDTENNHNPLVFNTNAPRSHQTGGDGVDVNFDGE
eukprot:PhM_4_TR4825/c0_g1_i1/m.5794